MIRLIEHTDAQELFELTDRNREYLKKWLPWLDYTKTVDDTRNFIKSSLHDYADKKSMIYVIVENKKICGVCSFNSFNDSIKAGYIGYWIGEEYQGKGLVTNSCKELETIGFEKLGLNKIEIHAATGNKGSQAVAKRLGYEETGKVLDAEWLYDHYVDHVIYCKKASK